MIQTLGNAQKVISEKIMPLDGWLVKEAAIFTAYLMLIAYSGQSDHPFRLIPIT
jgi:hypothetical protein